MNQHSDNDFPLLTDVIPESAPQLRPLGTSSAQFAPVDAEDDFAGPATPLPDLQQIQDRLSAQLSAELSLQVPVLVEAALREHLPQAMGARLQAELLTVLTNALPAAAKAAARELSAQVAYEVGGLLEQRLQAEVRRAVTDEIARLTGQA